MLEGITVTIKLGLVKKKKKVAVRSKEMRHFHVYRNFSKYISGLYRGITATDMMDREENKGQRTSA